MFFSIQHAVVMFVGSLDVDVRGQRQQDLETKASREAVTAI